MFTSKHSRLDLLILLGPDGTLSSLHWIKTLMNLISLMNLELLKLTHYILWLGERWAPVKCIQPHNTVASPCATVLAFSTPYHFWCLMLYLDLPSSLMKAFLSWILSKTMVGVVGEFCGLTTKMTVFVLQRRCFNLASKGEVAQNGVPLFLWFILVSSESQPDLCLQVNTVDLIF